MDELESRIKSDITIAREYDKWFYGTSRDKRGSDLTKNDLENFSFDDAIFVKDIYIKENCDYVYMASETRPELWCHT